MFINTSFLRIDMMMIMMMKIMIMKIIITMYNDAAADKNHNDDDLMLIMI